MIDNIFLGNGQISKALQANAKGKYKAYDIGEWENIETECKILNVCIPYTDNFNDIIYQAIERLKPMYLIIHSTVKPGTTKSILFNKKLYSPVNGRHEDDFKKNMCYYPKIYAGNKKDFDIIKDNFSLLPLYWGENTSELEYSKMMSTAYMFWGLIFQKLIHQDCEKEKFDFESVYTKWNTIYNNGIRLKHPEWQLPIYKYEDSNIPGGHCLTNNITLYDNFINNFCQHWIKTNGKFKAFLV